MSNRYELSYTIPSEHIQCIDKIRNVLKSVETKEQFYDILFDLFRNRTYKFKKYIGIFRNIDKIHTVLHYQLFVPFEISEEDKNLFVNKLNNYIDVEMSLYGPQTYNCNIKNCALGNPVDILKGRNKS